MQLVAEASTGREAVEKFRSARPDVTLMDLQLPEMSGIECIIAIRSEFPNARIIVLTTYPGDVQVVRALKAGARDFLIGVVTEALAASQQARQINDATESTVARLATLTHREREVLERLMEGQPNKTIAYELGTSPRTVEVQRARVMEKMGARSLAELVRMVLAVNRPAANQVVRLT